MTSRFRGKVHRKHKMSSGLDLPPIFKIALYVYANVPKFEIQNPSGPKHF